MKKVSYSQKKSDLKLIFFLALLIFVLLYYLVSFIFFMLKKYRKGQITLRR